MVTLQTKGELTQAVEPGGACRYQFIISADAEALEAGLQAAVESGTVRPEWASIALSAEPVQAGEERVGTVTIAVPPGTPEATHYFVVRVAATGQRTGLQNLVTTTCVMNISAPHPVSPPTVTHAPQTPVLETGPQATGIAELTVVVTNPDRRPASYTLVAAFVPAGLSVKFEPETVAVAPGSSAQVRMAIVRSGAEVDPGTYSLELRAHADGDVTGPPAAHDAVVLNVTKRVAAAPEVAVLPPVITLAGAMAPPFRLRWALGMGAAPLRQTITIENPNTSTRWYKVQVGRWQAAPGDPIGVPGFLTWATPETFEMNIKGVGEYQKEVTLTLQRDDAPAGVHRFLVRVWDVSRDAEERVYAIAEVDGEVTVEGIRQFQARFVENRARGTSGTFRIEVENTGSQPLDVALQAEDPQERLTFRWPAPGTIEAGGRDFIPLKVNARRNSLIGQEEGLPFSVTVRAEGSSDEHILNGRLVHRPLMGSWVGGLLTILLAIAFAGLLLWIFFGLVRPATCAAFPDVLLLCRPVGAPQPSPTPAAGVTPTQQAGGTASPVAVCASEVGVTRGAAVTVARLTRIRAEAGTAGQVQRTLSEDVAGTVADQDCRRADGLTWWNVRLSDGLEGWAAERTEDGVVLIQVTGG